MCGKMVFFCPGVMMLRIDKWILMNTKGVLNDEYFTG